jgi:aminoglycoside phosphotransferase (APT) family kinase protein
VTEQRRLVGEGREAEIFEWDEGRVLRLMRDPDREESMHRSVAAMAAARASGAPVPEVFEEVTLDGRPGVVMSRVDGDDLFAEISRRPWRFVGYALELGVVHARLHDAVAPPSLMTQRELSTSRIERVDLDRDLRELALATLTRLPDGDRVLHGDFHPGNVLVTTTGPVVIDWTNAARGDAAADVARTQLMLRLGAVPPGTPALIRMGDRFGRRGFLTLYRRAYRRHRIVDENAVARWEIVRAADRLAEGIEEEEASLVGFLRAAARAS